MASAPAPRPYVGLRLIALFYDAWPVVALWMLISAAFTFGYFLAGHPSRENIPPFSPLAWVLWLTCWLAAGGYAVASWSRGGQTLGMRPWRLRLVSDGPAIGRHALVVRYVVGSASLLLGGLGFWWAWIDRDRLTWHDRASGTRLERIAKG